MDRSGTPGLRRVPAAATAAESAPGVLGHVERLTGLLALTGGIGYVSLNALYVEFYDDFGLRPEDVGWTQAAIVGRAAWVAFVAVATAAVLGLVTATVSVRYGGPGRQRHPRDRAGARALVARRLYRHAGVIVFVGAALLLLSFWFVREEVEQDADEVKAGHSVDGVGFLTALVDAQVNRATVEWIGDPMRAPRDLVEARFLSYLGSNGQFAAFVNCGRTTVVVPANTVAVQIVLRDPDRDENRQEADFDRMCR